MSTPPALDPRVPDAVQECIEEGEHNVFVDGNGYCATCGYLDLGICHHTGGPDDRECACMGWTG